MKDSVVQKINIISAIATGMFAGGVLMVGVTFGLRWSRLDPAQLVQDFPQDLIYIAATIIPIALVPDGRNKGAIQEVSGLPV
ncbi:MAG: hypothetical protein HC886_10050 [Leptolyngbyaceae cyanobacterium SM1_1_3]|nr:hypothetical protein [Leptolyngbyaceae cyanobacterium SM1_1_3]NJN05028.1 hypothetical protein [Leptolyngbyaceae cyanobacterium RM1_1_2]NJO11653.1 hypothetical protein [Leptolyngbyaceae cyanobacterium SL_1_1]